LKEFATNQSQYLWLPKPWVQEFVYLPGTGLNYSDKTIRFLLDDNPKKKWLTYA
jgi:hypothetical protein